MVGKQNLRGQPLGFGNEVVATITGNAHAAQNDRVEQFGVVDHGIRRHPEREIVWFEGRLGWAGNVGITADGKMFDDAPPLLSKRLRIQCAEHRQHSDNHGEDDVN